MDGATATGTMPGSGSAGLKRFYRQAEAVAAAGGFQVALDGRPVHTPLRAALLVPSRALAEAIAVEWNGQGERVLLPAMPLTRLAATAIDRVAGREADIVDEILAYAETDLVCYRAERPESLVQRQVKVWQPVLDWLCHHHHVRLVAKPGVGFIDQPEASLAALRRCVDATAEPHSLAGLYNLVHGLGSLALGLAVRDGYLAAEAAFAAAMVDELYQAELWGEDDEAARRRADIQADVAASARFLDLLRAG